MGWSFGLPWIEQKNETVGKNRPYHFMACFFVGGYSVKYAHSVFLLWVCALSWDGLAEAM